jgi:hypothetical protein
MLPLQKSDLTRTLCFSVQAASEPSVLPRLVELFAKRGLVPTALHSRCHDRTAGPLQIDIEMAGMERDLADYLQRCMRQFVGVELVLVSEKHCLLAGKTGSAA